MMDYTNMETISPATYTVIKNGDEPLISENNVLLQNKQTQEVIWVPLTQTVQTEFAIIQMCQTSENDPREDYEEVEIEKRMWKKELTLFLINAVEKLQDDFEQGLKKNVWAKIAQQCSAEFHKDISAKQVETKWKALKRTYKSVLLHNNKSGKNRRHWEYFDIMNKFMHKKPEIAPEATCSSSSGLKLKNSSSSEPENTESCSFESTFQKKRKQRESNVNKRHQDKMKRLDRFNDIFEQMIKAIQPDNN